MMIRCEGLVNDRWYVVEREIDGKTEILAGKYRGNGVLYVGATLSDKLDIASTKPYFVDIEHSLSIYRKLGGLLNGEEFCKQWNKFLDSVVYEINKIVGLQHDYNFATKDGNNFVINIFICDGMWKFRFVDMNNCDFDSAGNVGAIIRRVRLFEKLYHRKTVFYSERGDAIDLAYDDIPSNSRIPTGSIVRFDVGDETHVGVIIRGFIVIDGHRGYYIPEDAEVKVVFTLNPDARYCLRNNIPMSGNTKSLYNAYVVLLEKFGFK